MDNKTVEEETTTIQNGISHDHNDDLKPNSTDDITGKSAVVEALNTSSNEDTNPESSEPIAKTVNGDSLNSEEAATGAANLNQSTDEDCFIVSSDNENDSDLEDNDVMITGISDTSGELQWRNLSDPVKLFYSLMMKYGDPASILLNVFHVSPSRIPPSPDTQKALLFHILSEPQPRRKLPEYNTLDDVLSLLHTCTKIIVITGAGISVSCGIPDFRSRNGIYARLAIDYPDLTTPQSMFELTYFKTNQKPFFKFAREIYPGQYKPSISHRFIKCLESRDKLLRNYTQNIDTLEQEAGISRVINCHGSFATASCMSCKYELSGSEVKADILSQKIPRCPNCPADDELAVMKPDIVFFGEELPEKFHSTFAEDKENADFVIVIGSSLKVRPVAYMPASLPSTIPQILINREPLSSHEFDVELLGDCDVIIGELCQRLGWSDVLLQQSDEDSTASPTQSNSQTDGNNTEIVKTVDPDDPATNTVLNDTETDKEDKKPDTASAESDSTTTTAAQQPPVSEDSESISKSDKDEEKKCDENKISSDSTTEEKVVEKGVSSTSGGGATRVKILNPPLITTTSSNNNGNSPDMEPCTSSSVNKIIFNTGKLTEIDGELLLIEEEAVMSSEPDASNDEKCQPKNLSDKLPAGSFACFKPNTYIFRGAEYFHLPEDSEINSVETLSSDSDDDLEEDCRLVQGHRASHPLCVSDDDEDDECNVGSQLDEEMECIIDSDDDSEDVRASVCWKQRNSVLKTKRTHKSKKSSIIINQDSEDVLEIESGTDEEAAVQQPNKKIKLTTTSDENTHPEGKGDVPDVIESVVSNNKVHNNNDSESSTEIVTKSISNEVIQPAQAVVLTTCDVTESVTTAIDNKESKTTESSSTNDTPTKSTTSSEMSESDGLCPKT